MDVPGAGAAPSSARRGSAPCFPACFHACRPGTLRPGMEGWPGGPRCPVLAAVSGVPAGPGPVGRETSAGKVPRRAASEGWGSGGRLPRGQGRWLARALAPLLARSLGVPGMRGLEPGSPPLGAGKCLRSCPLPAAARGARRLRGSPGRASPRFACAELLCTARLARRSSQGHTPRLPPPSGEGKI